MLRCNACSHLWDSMHSRAGERCGVRLSGEKWCDGVLVEHQCGGPSEACGLHGCDECGGPKEATIARLTRERDEARAEVEGAEKERQALADVLGELDAWGCACAFGGLPKGSGACLTCKCRAAHSKAIEAGGHDR